MPPDLGLDPKHALTLLARLARRRPEEMRLIEHAVFGGGRFESLAEIAVEVGMETGDPIGLVLAKRMTEKPDPARARFLKRLLSVETTALGEVVAVVTRILLEEARYKAVPSDEDGQEEIVRLASNLASCLAHLYRFEEALEAAEEGITVGGALSSRRPREFQSDLARCLNTKANCLSQLGRSEEALAAAEDAVTMGTGLTRPRLDLPEFAERYLWRLKLIDGPVLAGSLNVAASVFSKIERREEALAAAEQAVALVRELVRAWPDRAEVHLAKALMNLSCCFSDLDRREEALAPAGEAVTLCRALASAHPDGSVPNLIVSLQNVVDCLRDVGRDEEALAAAEEAVTLSREFARTRPDASRYALPLSLTALMLCLNDLGRREDALAAASEVMMLARTLVGARALASDGVDAFDYFLLATSLSNFAACLSELNRREEALVAIEEGVTIGRALARVKPKMFGATLVTLLKNKEAGLSDVGRQREALAAGDEAVTLSHTLAGTRPDALRPDLALPGPDRHAVDIPSPHPLADPERAARLNIEYQERRRQWRALSFWKRLVTKPPTAPKGI